MSSTTTRSSLNLHPIGFGTMNLTWKPVQTPDEQSFECLRLAVDAAEGKGKVMVNSGEFYGSPDRELNLHLLNRFFTTYPAYRSKIFLSVKGALTPQWKPDSSDAYLRQSVENINKLLGCKMDLFEPARVDQTRPIEDTVRALKALVDEGHFTHIGLSEVSGATIRKAHAVTPIAAVEAEYSPWALDIEQNDVLAACKELGIALIAYSPLGRGFLTGQLRSPADIPADDLRHHLDRFSAENFPKNLELVDAFTKIAEKKGVTNTQLALAWNLAQWEGIIPIPGSTRPAGVTESMSAVGVKMTSEELKEIRELIEKATIIGGRYNAMGQKMLAV